MVSASAPGRLDVMGGIADYSGSLVLQMPIREKTRCTIEPRTDRIVEIGSASRDRTVTLTLDQFTPDSTLGDYETARSYFSSQPDIHWASYVAGVLLVLALEEGIRPETGLSISIDSDVPEGKGVSSSAALEVAAMRALLALTNVTLDPERIAALCQRAENLVAGAPCGIMDQMTASCGERGKLMKLLCQPAELQGFVDLPDGISIWGIDSGVRHTVTGSDYTTVRVGAAMGYTIIAEAAGERSRILNGYLANVGVEEYARSYSRIVPEQMGGREFLDQFGGISDPVVTVDPDRNYPVRAATSFPILEHERCMRFARLLETGGRSSRLTTKDLAMAGELMYLAHAGYSSCGLGSAGTDRIVELVKEKGYKQGLYGARTTGGGSGGSVAVMGATDSEHLVQEIAQRYSEELGAPVQTF